MSSSNNKDDEFINRVNRLISKDASTQQTDQELANRFTNVFSSQPIVDQPLHERDYHISDSAYNDDIDREIEKMLQDSDDEEDAIDDYIFGVLGEDNKQAGEKMEALEKVFMGNDDLTHGTDESDELIKRLKQETALDAKYQEFATKRDADLERRYHELKKDAPNTAASPGSKPKGSIPKPLSDDDLHDEIDDWCCICNDDATVECLGCEDDNKYCRECFFHTHRSESADYEATKHKSRAYKAK